MTFRREARERSRLYIPGSLRRFHPRRIFSRRPARQASRYVSASTKDATVHNVSFLSLPLQRKCFERNFPRARARARSVAATATIVATSSFRYFSTAVAAAIVSVIIRDRVRKGKKKKERNAREIPCRDTAKASSWLAGATANERRREKLKRTKEKQVIIEEKYSCVIVCEQTFRF